jgi:hypothetical protein
MLAEGTREQKAPGHIMDYVSFGALPILPVTPPLH